MRRKKRRNRCFATGYYSANCGSHVYRGGRGRHKPVKRLYSTFNLHPATAAKPGNIRCKSVKRVILSAPATLAWGDLTDDQQNAITGVFGEYVMPMPGTIGHAGHKIIDALVADTFEPTAIQQLGLPFALLGRWQWDGETIMPLQCLDAAFLNFLPDPSIMILPHNWLGWPPIML